MKLLIFGASGSTGQLVVKQALDKGHEVTAFVRNPEKITYSSPQLKVVKGDVLQPESIDKIMQGHDAVVCCLGAPANKTGLLRSEGTNNIISSMQKFAIRRLVCQTSLGFDDSEKILKNTPFVFKKIIVPFFLKKAFEDHSRQEHNIRKSSLNYTIVRPGNMTNDKMTGNYKLGSEYNDASWTVKIARADVAHFIVNEVSDNRYNKMTVGISY